MLHKLALPWEAREDLDKNPRASFNVIIGCFPPEPAPTHLLFFWQNRHLPMQLWSLNRYWPKVDSTENAASVMRAATWAPALSAFATGDCAILSMVNHHPVMGMDGTSLIDAALAAVVAWRMYRLSLPWAIAGLLIFIADQILTAFSNPQLSAFGIIGIIMLLYYINAVRGGLFIKRRKTEAGGFLLSKQQEVQKS